MVLRAADSRSRRLCRAVCISSGASAGIARPRARTRDAAEGLIHGRLSHRGIVQYRRHLVRRAVRLSAAADRRDFFRPASLLRDRAYAAGIATALWGWSLAAALVWGAAVSGGAALLVGVPTLRLHGLYFAIATLAFAEMVRILFELFRYQISIDGELIGPNGTDGFRNIRYIFDHNIDAFQFLLLIYSLLAAAMLGLLLLERSRLGVIFRMIGQDETLAELQGIPVARRKVLAAGIAGTLAGIGGGLYAHLTTYVEPRIFDIMLGVHS